MDVVILDTNFLLIPFSHGVDVEALIRQSLPNPTFIVFESSIRELETIQQTQSGKHVTHATAALQYAKRFFITPSQGHTDTIILNYCLAHATEDVYVATQDKKLKKRLQTCAKGVIVLRSQSHVEVQVH